MFSADDTSVRVALRVRPQLPREKIDMCRICTSVTPGEPHIMLGSDKAFTYDNVFDLNAKQESIYSECVSTLIEGCFDGYNATVLAYGQTGSGKTYTMGTGFDVSIAEQEELGIVPRAVHHLFDGIEQRRLQAIKHGEAPPEFKVHAEFLELYNEDIIDLFDPSRDDKNKLSKIKIHEDPAGGIYVAGVTSRLVTSENDTLDALKQGALSRTTASTQMNNMSSRSHAIFTLHIKQQRVCKNQDTDADEDTTMESGQLPEFEALSAKFHFVDLAGSERLKRTGATGDRAKEGISINCGLLALGNVISALGDKAKKATHVPYRDSKLTRLLQDSLGGNSRTLMIACIAPCDRDFMETLNTLKYANRARNIKNKVVVNQDKTSKQIAALRVEIIALQNELMEYKTGKRQVDSEGLEHVNDMFNENTMMQAENNGLRVRIKAVQETVSALTQRNAMLLSDRTIGGWINHEDGETDEMASMIQNYIMEIEELRAKLLEAEASCDALRRREEMLARSPSRTPLSPFHMPSSSVMSGSYVDVDTISMSSSADLGTNILDEAKKELRQLKSKALNVSRQSSRASNEKDRDSYEDLSDQEIMETMGDSDNDNIAEEDEDDAGDEDSTDESDVEEEGMQEDLAELTSEINIKQKLIEELETNHRKMELLRHQYEEKLSQLHTRIRDTELERDQVLSNLNMKEKEANAKNIKEEYEKKLSSMQTEVKKLQAAKKEHDRLRQQQQRTERQLKSLQNELSEMKKAKVKLMTKLKEDAKRMAGREAEKSREIAGLRKTQRQRDNQIRTLEAEKKLKEVVLRRKQEELQSLKKNIMSDKVAGRVTRNRAVARPATRMQHVFNARVAHQKWTLLEKQISTITLKKQTLFNMEQDMDRWVKQREKLGKEMEMLTQKRDAAEQRHAEESITRDLSEQIDSVRANLDYVQDNISECQEQIVQLEDSKDLETGASGMSVNLSTLIENVRLEEAKYLLEHLFNAAVSKSMLAHQNESGYKELQAKIKQTEQNNAMHQQLLQYMLQERGELDVLTFLSNGELDGSGGDVSSGASSPSDSMMGVVPPLPGAQLLQVPKKDKARRKTATTEDLLYAGPRESQGSSVAPLLPVPSSYQAALEEELGEEEECSMPSKAFRESRLVTVLTSQEPSQGNRLGSRPESKTLPAAPVKDSSLMPPPKLPPPRPTSAANVRSTEPSPMLRRKISSSSQLTDPSPVMRRKNSFTLKSNSHSSSNLRGMSRQNSFNKKRNSANSINNLDSTGSTTTPRSRTLPPRRRATRTCSLVSTATRRAAVHAAKV
ncbi:PREDICTED: kinesin-like protein KIF21A isoform X2 [Priapulus caudatus]|uniref:Kinesin-like protein KIF21A isoform X2 n=1 Tax=Priapulus caudatus TaxID=37621 RepID=A0ABM1E046_PRICU|nr:PREDICTED: kinesin-like protein KIF21A isoform X2 [Priapulus caudatus]